MVKPFYLSTKRHGGNFYVQFKLSDGSLSFQKSTGTPNRSEAEKIAMSWLVNGNIPKRINSAAEDENKTSVEKLSLLNKLHTLAFSSEDIDSIIGILKERKYILSAMMPSAPESKPIEPFLDEFWDYDKSPYIREKKLKGHDIHRSYCETMKSRIKIYWLPRLKNRPIGSITIDDVNAIFDDKNIEGLASKTINSIISSLTLALKWAYYKHYTENNCYDGIIKCAVKSENRKILTTQQAEAVFKASWENDSAKLANLLAMYTGMRQGEIAGLRLEDIGETYLSVRHSWSKYDGLKCCKNGEERKVPVSPQLRDALRMQAGFNPHNEGLKGFVFFGQNPGHPTDPKNWVKYFHRALESIGYSKPEEICFHSWRHYFISRISDIEMDKRVIMAVSGHKTETMLNHYAGHLEEGKALEIMSSAAEKLFLPVVEETIE